jgi:hypothetical protein
MPSLLTIISLAWPSQMEKTPQNLHRINLQLNPPSPGVFPFFPGADLVGNPSISGSRSGPASLPCHGVRQAYIKTFQLVITPAHLFSLSPFFIYFFLNLPHGSRTPIPVARVFSGASTGLNPYFEFLRNKFGEDDDDDDDEDEVYLLPLGSD